MSATMVDLADRHFMNNVGRLHARGPWLMAELLAELGRERLITGQIERLLDRYLEITDEALDLTGGRYLPPAPLRGI